MIFPYVATFSTLLDVENFRFIHMTDFFSTNIICDICDKYEVWIGPLSLFSWDFVILSTQNFWGGTSEKYSQCTKNPNSRRYPQRLCSTSRKIGAIPEKDFFVLSHSICNNSFKFNVLKICVFYRLS